MKNTRNLKKMASIGFSMTVIAALLAGCGGGGGFSLPLSAVLGGKVTDGYVAHANVRFDLNDNGTCTDANEIAPGHTIQTDAAGNFTTPQWAINNGKSTHMVCASGGTDLTTGQLFVGEMRAPGGSTQVTPLTTLVQATLQAAMPAGTYTPPLPAAINAAATTVATNLGIVLPVGATLNDADPVALATSNPTLTQATTAVQTMLLQIANNVAAAATNQQPTPAQTTALYNSAIAGVAAAVAAIPAGAPINLATSTNTVVDTLVTTAVKNTVADVQAVVTAGAGAAAGTPAANALASLNAGFTTTPTAITTSFTVGNAAALVPANVAAVSAANITATTQTVAQVPATQLVAPSAPGVVSASLAAQTNVTGAIATATIASTGLLDATNATLATSPTALAALTTIALAQNAAIPGTTSTELTTAATTIQTASNIAPTVVAVVIPVVTPPPAPVNDLAIASATVTGTSCPGIVPATTVCTISLAGDYTVGGPIATATLNFGAATGTPVTGQTVTASFDVVSAVVGDNRTFSGTISGLTVVSGILTVPATATATVAGTHTNGTAAAATATGTAISPWISGNIAANGSATLNVGAILTALAATPVSATNAGFTNLNLLKGDFYVTVSLSGVALSSAGFPVTSQVVHVIVQ